MRGRAIEAAKCGPRLPSSRPFSPSLSQPRSLTIGAQVVTHLDAGRRGGRCRRRRRGGGGGGRRGPSARRRTGQRRPATDGQERAACPPADERGQAVRQGRQGRWVRRGGGGRRRREARHCGGREAESEAGGEAAKHGASAGQKKNGEANSHAPRSTKARRTATHRCAAGPGRAPACDGRTQMEGRGADAARVRCACRGSERS